jgi:hypothetical protein
MFHGQRWHRTSAALPVEGWLLQTEFPHQSNAGILTHSVSPVCAASYSLTTPEACVAID